MTIKELLEMANQSLVKLGEEDADDLAACQTWAIAAHAYAATAQAMILREMTINGTNFGENIRWLRVDTGE